MRVVLSAALAIGLAGSPAMATDALAPGQAAGTQDANLHTSSFILFAGIGGFVAGLTLILMHAHASVSASGTTAVSGNAGVGGGVTTTTTTG